MKKKNQKKAPFLPQAAAETKSLQNEYKKFLSDVKSRIESSQFQAALAVNRELLALYWNLGKSIVEKQGQSKWGDSIIDHLSIDLQKSFPKISGFSSRNIWRMRSFYLAYPPSPKEQLKDNFSFLPQAVAEIPWGHHSVILEKIKDKKARIFYSKMTTEYGWSRAILTTQIESNLYARQGKALSNFKKTLPARKSDAAKQTLKDPYIFDFLSMSHEMKERDLEKGLIEHIEKFLLELGVGFTFVGRQVPLKVGKQDFYLDLLFYHLKLRCFVVIELKTVPFEPEFAGKMNFYLSAVDEKFKQAEDQPTIGLLLCKSKEKIIVEYALRDTAKPIGVASWKVKLVEALPKNLKSSLPTVKQIEDEFEDTDND